MPIYEYRCTSCEKRFEELQPSSASPPPSCPACGARTVTRLYSPFATEWKPSIVNWHRMPGKW
jgi:putative FmdB family regulatory protein